MSPDPARVRDLAAALAHVHGSTELRRQLDEACGDDDALRAAVEAQLASGPTSAGGLDIAATFVDGEPADAGVRSSPAQDRIIAGRNELLSEIGTGGMGTVWRARQREPIERLVALKLVRAGLDSAQVVESFEGERQVLALMDHPHIAKVFDAGTAADGRPYFVMELVDGAPITEHCDRACLSIRERLKLFASVCSAVQHAHQKGVIHRDLKPSNVLVTTYDGVPSPKVIDFGVAKAFGEQPVERTMFAGLEGIVGTLEYMSPEQAEGGALAVDTRSDVYSLGVMLYELVTGAPPWSFGRLTGSVVTEAFRAIREERPPTPSTRLSRVVDTEGVIATARGVEIPRLVREVRGDLDWIVMKALEKDRERRYETCNALARDVERFLGGDPIEARPPSVGYRLHTYARKYRAVVLTAAGFVLLLIAGAAAATWQAIRATSAEAEAVAGRTQAEAVVGLLTSVFRKLDPDAERERGVTIEEQLRESLGTAVVGVEQAAGADPVLLARVRTALASCFVGLGEFGRAGPLLAEAIDALEREDPSGPDLPLAWLARATSQLYSAQHADALATFDTTLERFGDRLATEERRTLRASRAHVLGLLGSNADAAEILEAVRDEEIAALGPDHPAVLETEHKLAVVYRELGRIDQAIALFERVATRRESQFGPVAEATTRSQNGLAIAYGMAGRHDDSIALLERVVEATNLRLPADHSTSLVTKSNLAIAYGEVGRSADAREVLERSTVLLERKLGPDHELTQRNVLGLARARVATGAPAAALELVERFLARADADSTDETVLGLRNERTRALLALGRNDEALASARAQHGACATALGPFRRETVSSQILLADVLVATGEPLEAIPLLTTAIEGAAQLRGPSSEFVLEIRHRVGVAHFRAGQFDDAVRELTAAHDGKVARLGRNSITSVQSGADLGGALLASEHAADARPLLEQALAAQEIELGPTAPATLVTAENLGHCLAGLGEHAAVLALLEVWLPRLTAARGDHDPTIIAMAEVLWEACDALGEKEKALQPMRLLADALVATRDPFDEEVLSVRFQLGRALWFLGHFDESVPLWRALHRGCGERFGAQSMQAIQSEASLGTNLLDSGDATASIAVLESALQHARAGAGDRTPLTWSVWSNLLLAKVRIGDAAGAAAGGRELLALANRPGPYEDARASVLGAVGYALLENGEPAAAEPLVREAVAIRERAPGPGLGISQSSLGAIRMQLGDLHEAEPLLIAGATALEAGAKETPVGNRWRIREALQRVVRFYETRGADGDAERVALWQAKLDELAASSGGR